MITKWINQRKEVTISTHAVMIDFIYQLLFSRPAEQAAIDHWSTFLDQGLSYKDLFEQLWHSQEFASKVEQNSYFKDPQTTNQQAHVNYRSGQGSELISDEMLQRIIAVLSEDKSLLFQIHQIRSLIATWRYRDLRGAENVLFYDVSKSSGVIDNTIAHNESAIRTYIGFQRGDLVINPLASIGWVRANVANLKVLSIGARNEMELFSLLALGFDINHITLVDLISYSPYIELGDMHQLTYSDHHFDIVVLSNVFLCSNNKAKAASEILRVLKPGGIVAFGDKHALKDCDDPTPVEARMKSEYLCNVDEVISLFQPHVNYIYFKCDPLPPYQDEITSSIIVVFSIK